MLVSFDENGYVKEWIIPHPDYPNEFAFPEGIEIPDFISLEDVEAVEKFCDEFESYHMVKKKLTRDDAKMETIRHNRKLNGLRADREVECFEVINRSNLWYNTLNNEQKVELDTWYHAWLDVTDTLVVPERPKWLK